MLATELTAGKKPTESSCSEAALLRRIMIHKPEGEGSYGRGYQNYRCRMLWYNKFTKKWECLIHKSKPQMCKNFEPGDDTLSDDKPCRQEKLRKENNAED
jgi:Fe-S-cluster containining protein